MDAEGCAGRASFTCVGPTSGPNACFGKGVVVAANGVINERCSSVGAVASLEELWEEGGEEDSAEEFVGNPNSTSVVVVVVVVMMIQELVVLWRKEPGRNEGISRTWGFFLDTVISIP
jgi:hypothetical protein